AEQSVKGMADGRVVLTDAEGRIIADSSGASGAEPRDVSKLPMFAKLERPGQAVQRSGLDEAGRLVRAMSVGLRAPVSGWHVVAMTPQSTVDAQGRQLRNRTALFALLLIFPALGLAAWLAGWLSRPIRALAKTANALTASELDAPLPDVSPSAPREMQQLTQAIRSMIQKLQGHSQQLEGLVAQRTAELLSTNHELAGALETIRENERRIREDIAKARLFQERMLSLLPKRPGLDIAARYAPLEDVSGDIYDVTELLDGRLRVFIVDATGHGVQASMRTIFLKSAYDRLKVDSTDPADVLSRLNELLVAEFPEGELHSEACCLDLQLGGAGVEVQFASAGNTPLFVFSPGAAAREHYTGGPLLGVESVAWPPPEHFQLAPGELLLVSSDGLYEQWNDKRQRFDVAIAGLDIVADGADASLERLLTSLDAFRGQQPIGDDLTMIGIWVPPSVDGHDLVRQPA
ncbi:MAG TPA: SpoIIE family protein phosphatase, partial [Polyangiaceae bacterium]|nr:SpoIIE family protein phosphatase [Polyangiaceae bacterium]